MAWKKYLFGTAPSMVAQYFENVGLHDDYDDAIQSVGENPDDEDMGIFELSSDLVISGTLYCAGTRIISGLTIEGCPFWVEYTGEK